MRRKLIMSALVQAALLLLLQAQSVLACPNCKDAYTTGKQAALGAGYSWSVLFMLGMPMIIFGGIALNIVRLMRRRQQASLN